MKNKHKKILAVAALLSIGITGCAKNPEESIVVNKDMDKLIEKANDNEQEGLNIKEDSEKYTKYKTHLKNENLGVIVNVDANVDIPKTDKLSMYKVEQMKITPELIARIKKELVKDTVLYNGAIIELPPRVDVKKNIQSMKEDIKRHAQMLKEFGVEDEQIKKDLEIYQEEVNRLLEKYEKSPQEYIFKDEDIVDDKFSIIKSYYENNPDNDYWKWAYDLEPEGDIYYGVSNGENDNYTLLYAHNSSNYGNVIRFRTGNHGYERVSSLLVEVDERVRWKGTSATTKDLENIAFPSDGSKPIPDLMEGTVTLSKEAAIKMADDFLKKVQIDDFEYYDGDIYTEWVHMQACCDLENVPCRSYYILRYMRSVNGTFVTFNNVKKDIMNGNDIKSLWPIEVIEFRINDNGIVGFDYNAPLELTETVVENTYMKSFEEIQKVFEDMVMVKNATENEDDVIEVDVNRVVLGYARICEEDTTQKGFLIPVWEFEGSKKAVYDGFSKNAGKNILTINAIDGSIVDRRLGY